MTWEAIVLIALFTIGGLATVLTIGEPRKPTTPGIAVVTIILDTFLIYLVLRLANG
jgi:hypothetical protein